MTSQRPIGGFFRRASLSSWVVFIALVVLGVALADRGYGFYRLEVSARVEHADYRTLSPSGLVGHGYGIVGTAMMLTNLLYLVRRRFPNLPVGSMRLWLDIHVFTGLGGAMLVLFHSAFQLRTPLASASLYSVGFVVLTGLIGRNMVAFAPRSDLERMAEGLTVLDEYLPGIRREIVNALHKHHVAGPPVSVTLFGALRLVPTYRRQGEERRRLVMTKLESHGALPELPPADRERLREAIDTVTSEAAREAYAVGTRLVLDSWRGFHRVFAFLLVVSVTVHVGVAWYYGFRWIFSEP